MVIGSPISHSLSPAIFTLLSSELGVSLGYDRCEVKGQELPLFLRTCRNSTDLVGLNVTLPLKELMPKEVDELGPEVRATGAINVVHFQNGRALGRNTDVVGIEKTFERSNFSLSGSHCLLFGAGGSAKSVAYVLGKKKVKSVTIFNRSQRGQDLVSQFSSLYPETEFTFVSNPDDLRGREVSLLINSTPLGMTGSPSGVDFFSSAKGLKFSENALAFDLIYTPEETDFIRFARSQHVRTIGGLGMLIDQALATWKIWMGPLKQEEELHLKLTFLLRGILRLRRAKKSLYLTGFMGSGKSTVGKELAKILGHELLETDRLVEENCALSIPQIFEKKGETLFRDEESLVLQNLSKKNNLIVSLGGGALTREENLKRVQEHGTLVYLKASEHKLAQRVRDQKISRPLLDQLEGEALRQKISHMLAERKAHYERANVTIETGELTATQVALQILEQLGEARE